MMKALAVLAAAAFIPVAALATGKPKTPEVVTKTIYVDKECRHCKRDRYGLVLLGVAATVLVYETQRKDKAVALVPTEDGGVQAKFQWNF